MHSLHKTRSSTTLYYKACTKHFQVLLCTTKLAQSTSQYYFVLQSLQKLLPSTTLYYKACTKHFPVLICTTKLTQTKHVPVLLCTTKLAQRRRKLQLQKRISTQKRQKDDFEALYKRNFKRKITIAKIAKICWQITIATWMQPLHYDLHSSAATLSQPGCSHSITIYILQLQKTIVLRMQPRHQATLTQAFQWNLQRLSCKTQENYAQRPRKLQLQNRDLDAKATKRKQFLEGILKGKLLAPKLRKSAGISISQPWSSHYNAFCSITQLPRISLRT